jgi:hypothetical protein
MIPERGKEHLVEEHPILPKRALGTVFSVKAQAGTHGPPAQEAVHSGRCCRTRFASVAA